MPITTADVLEYLHRSAEVLKENKQYLTELDSPIGDADHGINMDRGFTTILKKVPPVQDKDAGTILKTAGMAIAGKHELTAGDILAALEAALQGVMMRGKSKPGQKTMIDAIDPAIQAMREALENGAGTEEALEKATAAAEQGMKATIPMLAMKGRASYLGERSIGHQDPGATSSYLLIRTMYEMARKEE